MKYFAADDGAAGSGRSFECTVGEGRLRVNLVVIRHDEGLTAILIGGEKTHVGAVTLATVSDGGNESTDGAARQNSASVQVICAAGHRDDVVARETARTLCEASCEPVAVSAGIHIEAASPDEIRQIVANCREAAAAAAKRLRADRWSAEEPLWTTQGDIGDI